MTIKEAAAFYGVSPQAIYQRLTKAGKKTKDVTNHANGELTTDGAELLESWFTNQTNQEQPKQTNDCKALENEISVLQAEKKALQAENAALQVQVNSLQADKDRLYTLLNQAQQTAQALTLARIGSSTEKKRPIWERLKVFVIGEKDESIQG